MANFSSFFPSAAGGGGDTATTIEVGGIKYGNVYTNPNDAHYVLTAARGTSVYFSHTKSSSTALDSLADSNLVPYDMVSRTLDTYYTVVNVTSATNGGFFHFLLGGSTTTSLQAGCGMKITIDGTAYEYTHNGSNLSLYSYNRYFLGPHIPITQSTEKLNNFIGGGRKDNANITNGLWDFTGTSYPEAIYIALTDEIHYFNLPKIYFETSCKVEFKQLNYAVHTNVQYRNAIALVETL